MRRVTLRPPVQELWFWDPKRNAQTYDLGAHILQVGPDAQATERLTVPFVLKGVLTPSSAYPFPAAITSVWGSPGNASPSPLSAVVTTRVPVVPIHNVSSAPAIAAVGVSTGPGLVTITATCSEGSTTVEDTSPVCAQGEGDGS